MALPRYSFCALSVTLCLGAGGCVTSRVNQFHNFAAAGTAYVDASQTVLDQAGAAAIDADSLIAVSGRDALKTADARRQYILGSDEALRKRLLLLRQIGEHGKLLQSYFESLADLADRNAPPGLDTAAEGLYSSILQLSPTLKNGTLGGSSIQRNIPQATDFAVQAFEVKALEQELQKRSKDIERELALQEAAFKAIADNLVTDLTVRLQLQESQDVIEPYAATAKLLPAWVNRRQNILQARVAAECAQSVVKAASSLRESFMALVENRLTPDAILQTLRSIHSIRDIKDKIQKVSL